LFEEGENEMTAKLLEAISRIRGTCVEWDGCTFTGEYGFVNGKSDTGFEITASVSTNCDVVRVVLKVDDSTSGAHAFLFEAEAEFLGYGSTPRQVVSSKPDPETFETARKCVLSLCREVYERQTANRRALDSESQTRFFG
jgi:hypothetical protein